VAVDAEFCEVVVVLWSGKLLLGDGARKEAAGV
jgi:hypothetical protein